VIQSYHSQKYKIKKYINYGYLIKFKSPDPNNFSVLLTLDHLCGLVVRVHEYRSRGTGFDSRRYQIFWNVVGLERGPFILMRITEKLLERKIAAPV
jgi:hypothetical protein